ncbi:DUF4160 domain-containing protein [Duganella sp. FT80W]|uniref:DUF4160 domain-containing protein n=1 Tax=Duganella guangzhouensis TaxID=2666084 RepID=A0A6I2L4W3_9BURK|nr:DUF4160 domain-containing protein [Duganella guangzhouensis]MRW92792.1 DUF4160 domain-containing protein [Duganella guangzhouensis]
MPTISRVHGATIRMFYRDHLPPHFHVRYAGCEATIDIRKRIVLSGYLPPQILAAVVRWAQLHRDELLQNWRLCAVLQVPQPITPLR